MKSPEAPAGRCPGCGFRTVACFCEHYQDIDCSLRLTIISHPKELARSNSTGQLTSRVLRGTEQLIWQRQSQMLDTVSRARLVLLYPAEKAQAYRQASVPVVQPSISDNFVLIDGTWQEAHKIFRQSPGLQQLPLAALDCPADSQYRLRSNQQSGNLATVEVVIALLNQLQQLEAAQSLAEVYQRFQLFSEASQNNHSPAV